MLSKLLLLQYEHHLDLWKIAECDSPQCKCGYQDIVFDFMVPGFKHYPSVIVICQEWPCEMGSLRGVSHLARYQMMVSDNTH